MHDLLIENANVIDINNESINTLDIYIKNNKISHIATDNNKQPCYKRINAENCFLLPGLIDLYTNAIEEQALKHSGFVVQVLGPEAKIKDSNRLSKLITLKQQAPLTIDLKSENLAPIDKVIQNDFCGLSNGCNSIVDTKLLFNCYLYAASFNVKIFIQPQDNFLKQNGFVHDGALSAKLGINAIPDIAESIEVARQLELIEYTGISAHFHKISSAKSIELIKLAKDKGLAITADTSINNLLYIDEDIGDFDSNFHINPPIRSDKDRIALIDAINSGIIDAIVSDHTPIAKIHKHGPFALTKPGMSTIETFVSQFFNLFQLNESNILKYTRLVSKNPAGIINIKKSFFDIKIGNTANFCLYDPNLIWEVNPNSILSYGKNTPLMQSKQKGKVQATIANGMILHNELASQTN